MLIFDEKKYAQEILKEKKFKTYRQKDIERYILIRYLASEGLTFDEIQKKLEKFPLIGCEYLSKEEISLVYNKIIERALSMPLTTNISVKIFKEELDVINNLEDENERNLLFILLVYYKWALKNPCSSLYFFSKYNNVNMVVTNDIDIWKYANLMKLRVKDRYKICSELIKKNLYIEDNFKSNNYFYLPFIVDDDSSNPEIEINNYDNLLGELDIYNHPNEYKRCSKCNVVFKKTRSPKKYCNNCAKTIKNEKNKKYYNLGKTQSP